MVHDGNHSSMMRARTGTKMSVNVDRVVVKLEANCKENSAIRPEECTVSMPTN